MYDIAARAPDVTEPDTWRDNAPYLLGVRLYAAGFFWEAHEVWEPVWMRARPNSRERALLQGLIQLANAGLKAALGRPNAARRLARLAAAHFGDANIVSADRLMGLDAAACAAAAAAFAAQEPGPIPSIELHYNTQF